MKVTRTRLIEHQTVYCQLSVNDRLTNGMVSSGQSVVITEWTENADGRERERERDECKSNASFPDERRALGVLHYALVKDWHSFVRLCAVM